MSDEKEKIIKQLNAAAKRGNAWPEWRKKEVLGDMYKPLVNKPSIGPADLVSWANYRHHKYHTTPYEVVWFLADVTDGAYWPKFCDGPHITKEGAERAYYLYGQLGYLEGGSRYDGKKYAVVQVLVYEPKENSDGVDHDSLDAVKETMDWADGLFGKEGGASTRPLTVADRAPEVGDVVRSRNGYTYDVYFSYPKVGTWYSDPAGMVERAIAKTSHWLYVSRKDDGPITIDD